MFMQVFIPFPDNGGINIGAVVGPVVSVVVVTAVVIIVTGLVCWKKGKFVSPCNSTKSQDLHHEMCIRYIIIPVTYYVNHDYYVVPVILILGTSLMIQNCVQDATT